VAVWKNIRDILWPRVWRGWIEEYMAYFVVKGVVRLLGGINSIFCGEGCSVAVRKNTWHIL